jgi:NADH dehydrogenase/NADH:ubiquinone oxidoreductase subunit G
VSGQDKQLQNNTVSPGATATLAAVEGGRRPFVVCAEKCPNSRGVRRVLEAVDAGASGMGVLAFEDFLRVLGHGTGRSDVGAVVLTGNYPGPWAGEALLGSLSGKLVVLLDTLESPAVDEADIVLPASTFAEKAGTFENHRNQLQAFEQAIPPVEGSKPEGQIALDLMAELQTQTGAPAGVPPFDPVLAQTAVRARLYNAADTRAEMAGSAAGLGVFAMGVLMPVLAPAQEPDMAIMDL